MATPLLLQSQPATTKAQVGMALLKFLQTKQIFPAALAFHTLLSTAMAQTARVCGVPPATPAALTSHPSIRSRPLEILLT